MTPNSRLHIDLDAIGHNVRCWRAALGQRAGLCAVVKADAYGLGATPIARHLADVGVDMLAVYSVEQADVLLEADVDTPLFVLTPTTDPLGTGRLRACAARGDLHLSVDTLDQLADFERAGRRLGRALPVHLHVDTGMCRGGLHAEDAVIAAERSADSKHVTLAGVYTHFAAADRDATFTAEQRQRLRRVMLNAPALRTGDILTHVASTAGAVRDRRNHFDMVRIGLGLYGYGAMLRDGATPIDGIDRRLRPAVRWSSRLIHVQRYPRGERVGYANGHVLDRDSVLGLVPVGYGDGYALSASGRGVATLHDGTTSRQFTVNIVGRVNMDQVVVDLTDACRTIDVVRDMEVDLISNDPASPCALPCMADRAVSSCHETLCRVSPRVARVYDQTDQSVTQEPARDTIAPCRVSNTLITT